jgi:hypothetical protein
LCLSSVLYFSYQFVCTPNLCFLRSDFDFSFARLRICIVSALVYYRLRMCIVFTPTLLLVVIRNCIIFTPTLFLVVRTFLQTPNLYFVTGFWYSNCYILQCRFCNFVLSAMLFLIHYFTDSKCVFYHTFYFIFLCRTIVFVRRLVLICFVTECLICYFADSKWVFYHIILCFMFLSRTIVFVCRHSNYCSYWCCSHNYNSRFRICTEFVSVDRVCFGLFVFPGCFVHTLSHLTSQESHRASRFVLISETL